MTFDFRNCFVFTVIFVLKFIKVKCFILKYKLIKKYISHGILQVRIIDISLTYHLMSNKIRTVPIMEWWEIVNSYHYDVLFLFQHDEVKILYLMLTTVYFKITVYLQSTIQLQWLLVCSHANISVALFMLYQRSEYSNRETVS